MKSLLSRPVVRNKAFNFGCKFSACLMLTLAVVAGSANTTAGQEIRRPVLISQPTSTRAIALESILFTCEPFAVNSLVPWTGTDRRTRVTLFALNLQLQPNDDLSLVTGDGEDDSHRHYSLKVESLGPVPANEWMSAVTLRLSDDLGDVGDLLVRVSYRGVSSNRIRIGIGHVGGGLPDDGGAAPTPAPPYKIDGRVLEAGQGLGGVTLTLTGSQTQTVVTNSTGSYSFLVPRAGDYTLVPEKTFFNLSPTTRSFSNLSHDQTVNFDAVRQTHTISGRVQLGPSPAAEFVVPISGSQTGTTIANLNGEYSFTVPAGGNYTITPTLPFYDFEPVSQVITSFSSDQINRNFIGTRQLFAISGKLKDQNGNGLVGLTVNLTGFEQRTTTSDAGGNYQFAGLHADSPFTVSPPSTATYTFTPRSVANIRSNLNWDSTGLRKFNLNGKVKDGLGNGVPGVVVVMSGSETPQSTTAGDGSYSLTATATGNYTLTPTVPQDWYVFNPSTVQYDNLSGSQTRDFSVTLTPVSDPVTVLEFDGSPKTVDYSVFWQEGVDLGHFYWEFWATPGPNAGATYLLSDGYGGAHALLFGFANYNSSETNRYQLIGNIFDGVIHDHYFGSDQGPAVGEWGHFAVGWDGQSIVTYFDGVPVGKAPFLGPRRTPGPGGGGGRLLIGGSDHSNFDGRIAQVRGYEDENPREGSGVEASFVPETVFSRGGSLLSYFFRPGTAVADLSHGYNGSGHIGFPRGTTDGVLFVCEACPPPQFVIDPSAPQFATGSAPPPAPAPSPAGVPTGALVFDSFSRHNSTYLFGAAGGLGSTEGGAAGQQAWQSSGDASGLKPFGILNGRGVLLGNARHLAWVNTNSPAAGLLVSVERRLGQFYRSGYDTGLSFRVVDAQNYFFAYTSENGGSTNPRVLTVGYFLNDQRINLVTSLNMPATWTTLKVTTMKSGEIQVFADGTLIYSTSNAINAAAGGVGLYNNSAGLGLVNRWDNFTVYEMP